MSCGLLNTGCTRGMLLNVVLSWCCSLVVHCALLMRSIALDGPVVLLFVSFQMKSLSCSPGWSLEFVVTSALSAQVLLGFSGAVTGDGGGASSTAKGRGQGCLQVHAGF